MGSNRIGHFASFNPRCYAGVGGREFWILVGDGGEGAWERDGWGKEEGIGRKDIGVEKRVFHTPV